MLPSRRRGGYNRKNMKYRFLTYSMILLAVTACSGGVEPGSELAQLTPYITPSEATAIPTDEAAVLDLTPTPAITPTPSVHIVSIGETVSSIAYQYGVSIDAILAANPEISPNAMIVGDEVLIPSEGAAGDAGIDRSIPGDIVFNIPYCMQSGDGLWCSVLAQNQGEIDVMDTVVEFSFLDEAGEEILSKKTPAVLRQLPSMQAVPVVIFLDDVPAGFKTVDVSVFSAVEIQPQPDAPEIVEVERQVSVGSQSAIISGVLRVENSAENERVEVTLAAAAFDTRGNIVGVRRKDITVAVGSDFDFSMTVFSSADSIKGINFYSEVN